MKIIILKKLNQLIQVYIIFYNIHSIFIVIVTKRISNNHFSTTLNCDLFEVLITDKLLDDRETIDSFLFDCQCALFLIDITDKESFTKVKDLFSIIDFSRYTYLKSILVENKLDIESKREIDKETINQFIKDNNIEENIQISIKDGLGLEQLFEKMKKYIDNEENDLPINYVAQDKNDKLTEIKDLKKNLTFILIGDSNVGKTCFFTRFNKNIFHENFLSTIGMDKFTKYYKYRNEEFKITLWDTAGQDKFKSIPKKYYQNANGIFLLFDVNNKESFNDVGVWMKEINDKCQYDVNESKNKDTNERKKPIVIFLIGNKIDKFERVISKEEAEDKASFYGINYYEISCKSNMNIVEISSRMINECILKLYGDTDSSTNRLESKSFTIENFVKKKDGDKAKGTCC